MNSTPRSNEGESNSVGTIAELVPESLILHDMEGEIVESNDRARGLLGFTRAELAEMTVADIELNHSQQELRSRWTAMDVDERKTFEGRWRRKDRSTFYAEHTIRKVERDGEVLFVMATRDITERKHRKQELERRTRVMDEAPIGITMSDPGREDSPLVYVNEQFTELTGYPAEEIVGQNCRLLQGEDTDPERIARMRDAIDTSDPVTVELRNYRKKGTEFWNRLTIAPITNEDGEVANFVGFQRGRCGSKRPDVARTRSRRRVRPIRPVVPCEPANRSPRQRSDVASMGVPPQSANDSLRGHGFDHHHGDISDDRFRWCRRSIPALVLSLGHSIRRSCRPHRRRGAGDPDRTSW